MLHILQCNRSWMVPEMRFVGEVLLRMRTKYQSGKLTALMHTFLPRLRFDRHVIIGLAALAFTTSFGARADLGASATGTVYGSQVAAMPFTETKFARQIGRPNNVDELVRRMLTAIRAWSPYHTDVGMPMVRAIEREEMHRRLCGGPCTIRAAYIPGEGVYYDAEMKPLTNRYYQSILFHELVHHVQVEHASHSDFEECRRWGQRESEAYALQNRYLHGLGLSRLVLNPGKFCGPA